MVIIRTLERKEKDGVTPGGKAAAILKRRDGLPWVVVAVACCCAALVADEPAAAPAPAATNAAPGVPASAPPGVPAYWQAPALPTAVIQGGVIPPGWQPQALPYQGVGPDGKPLTMYFAPTYVFTYQSGPPVMGLPQVNRAVPGRPSVPTAPVASGWNYTTTGVAAAPTALPAGSVTRYRPAYQFPGDSRALQGAALVPPGPLPVSQPPVGDSPWGGAGPPVPNTLAPPPTQWVPAAPQAPPPTASSPVAPPPAGQWVAPVAIGSATAAAMQPSPAPVAPPTPPPAFSSSAPQMQPLQPLANPPTVPITRHAWRVVGVYDGDTVTCLDEAGLQQKVRLAGIDAPESSQDYGRTSREALAGMVFGRTVEVVDAGRDANGTSLGMVFVDGQDVNRQLVATGNAWADPAATDPALAAAQTAAQSQRLGLWAQPDPTPPWNFR
jgi:endonuclease YncB( thermonuclease family)